MGGNPGDVRCPPGSGSVFIIKLASAFIIKLASAFIIRHGSAFLRATARWPTVHPRWRTALAQHLVHE